MILFVFIWVYFLEKIKIIENIFILPNRDQSTIPWLAF